MVFRSVRRSALVPAAPMITMFEPDTNVSCVLGMLEPFASDTVSTWLPRNSQQVTVQDNVFTNAGQTVLNTTPAPQPPAAS